MGLSWAEDPGEGNLPAAEVQGRARPELGRGAPGPAVRVSRLRLVV